MPPIPAKLWKLDESTVGEHFSLSETDQCYYIWEYTAGKDFSFSPTNQLIKNLKIKPSDIAKSPTRNYYKQQAISHAATALRSVLNQRLVGTSATFVPVPGSKAAADPDYDDRMQVVLNRAFQGWAADIRPILRMTQSFAADHETTDRVTYEELLANAELLTTATNARPFIIVVDDVLTSGKHFKVAQTLLSKRFPESQIIGLFLARCIHDEPPAVTT